VNLSFHPNDEVVMVKQFGNLVMAFDGFYENEIESLHREFQEIRAFMYSTLTYFGVTVFR